jgi:hypothetical protein
MQASGGVASYVGTAARDTDAFAVTLMQHRFLMNAFTGTCDISQEICAVHI